MNNLIYNKKSAFTLAETLITLTILGIVAAIAIPALIKKQSDMANITKIKKAMSVYENVLNNIINENDIKTNNALINFGKSVNNVDCANTRNYFKTVDNGTVNGVASNCRFMTSDKVWWDITDINNPIIILKNDYKDNPLSGDDDSLRSLSIADNAYVYGMVGNIDDETGILRVNDKVYYGISGTALQKHEMEKLYAYIQKQKYSSVKSEQLLNLSQLAKEVGFSEVPENAKNAVLNGDRVEIKKRDSGIEIISISTDSNGHEIETKIEDDFGKNSAYREKISIKDKTINYTTTHEDKYDNSNKLFEEIDEIFNRTPDSYDRTVMKYDSNEVLREVECSREINHEKLFENTITRPENGTIRKLDSGFEVTFPNGNNIVRRIYDTEGNLVEEST